MTNSGGLVGAIDLGGTKILSLVLDERGEVRGEDLRPTEAAQGPDAVLECMRDSLQAALRSAGGGKLRAAGVAVPGPVDAERGVVAQAPNLPGWRDVPVGERLRGVLGCPIVVENDANAAAWGEFTSGAGKGCRHMVYLTISTGIGGGLILDGRLYRGANGAAGELGHVPLLPDGPRCGCHSRGCLESLASGTAIARDAAQAVTDGEAPLLERLAAGGPVTAAQVHEAADQGELVAIDIIDRAARYLGSGLVAFVNVFNPDAIVIGGGTAKIGARLLDPAIEELRTRAVHPSRDHVRVLPAALGDRAGALGAASLARNA